MDNKELNQKLSEGYLHVRTIVEIVGKPKEHVVESLKNHVEKIKKDTKIVFVKETVEEPEPTENYFSAFAEVEVLLKNPIDLTYFCFDYMPSSIEILGPENIVFTNSDLTGYLNDLQARLHALNTGFIKAKETNTFYIRNTAVLLRNFLVVVLSQRSLTLKEIQPLMGVKVEDIEKVLNVLIKENKVKKEGDKYRVIPKK